MRTLRHVLGLSLVSLLILAAVTANPAAAQSEDDALIHDAKQYAAAFEVEVDEALHRLKLQAVAGRLGAELAVKERATFGGLWIQHTPSYRVVAHFTDKGGHNLQDYLAAEGLEDLAPAIERRTVALSLRRLEAVQAAARRVARRQGIEADSRINVSENRVELLTTAPAVLVHAITAESRTSKEIANLQLPSNVEVIGVERLSRPQAYIYGGLQVTHCTSGFAVQSSGGALGISTAGHCDDTQAYNIRSLPYQNGQFSGSIDAQWHTAPDLFPTNRAFDGQVDTTTPSYRLITASKPRSQQVIGEFVCKYGMTSGYTCGTITSTTLAPGYIPGATATYVQVDNSSQDQSEPGDSGGPWFSGNTAYGLMSGGYEGGGGIGGVYNAAVYMAVDGLAPLGISVLTTTPDIPVGRWTYRDTGNDTFHYTGINASEYECGIGGFAARSGDINENNSGDIIQTYLYLENGHWRVRGNFRSHNNMESWDFDVFCLKKSAFPVSRFQYRSLGGNVNHNTYLSTTSYECGVGGLAARDGDIDESGAGDIIQTYMYRSSGTWRIRADFHSHNNGEGWDVDALCVEKWAQVVRYEFRNIGNNVTYNTFINSNTYECAVAGFAARDGDIEEHNTGDIIQAYLYKSAGNWIFRGDFRTHNDQESWDLDVLCVQR